MPKALIIKSPWIDKILAGEKTWEIRGSRTNVRGPIYLIAGGSGTIVGGCDVVGCTEPLSLTELRLNSQKTGRPASEWKSLPYPETHAWVLANAKRLARPRPYKHPSGAVIWVRL